MRSLTHLLARALSVPEDVRSEDEGMLIELILALVLNVLHTAHPDAPPPEPGRAYDALSDVETLRALLQVMEHETMLELGLYVLQQVEESPTFMVFFTSFALRHIPMLLSGDKL